ncbi:hypothetical protein AVEN_136369-1 [Araneus ventricosus]|uniref:Uncharacterized protein n=1 Tax=Araneus ventricosus TaxID=182803 RepID=A0A4Y2JQT0_ARAVE|nr:hypothetical protein AVEN_136369-1 [Araneus ventricosus]
MLIDFERVERLGSPWSSNVFGISLWSSIRYPSNASWTAGELSAIVSAVTAITSELMTVCVAKSESAVTVITCELLFVALLICSRSIVPVTCASLNIWE